MEIYVMHNGQQLGPFSLENVQAQLDSGILSAADYAWSVDIDDMTSLHDVMSKAVRTLSTDDRQPKQRYLSRIAIVIRAISAFIDRNLTNRRLLAGTVLLLIASWIYPPWIINGRSHGWFFVFDTTQSFDMRVDFGRLFLIDAIITAVGGLLAWAAFHNWTPIRMAVHVILYSLLIGPLIAVICLGTFLIHGRVIDRATFHAFPYLGAIPVGGEASQQKQSRASLNAVATPNAQVDFQPVDRSLVGPTDLNRISLFDVGVHGYKSSITGLYGRVRNDLARAVHKIAVKASFYTARDELIEVRTFWIKHGAGVSWEAPFFPKAPISFDEHLIVEHLPDGYKYELEVTEAHYAN
jgi:GYF domain 2